MGSQCNWCKISVGHHIRLVFNKQSWCYIQLKLSSIFQVQPHIQPRLQVLRASVTFSRKEYNWWTYLSWSKVHLHQTCHLVEWNNPTKTTNLCFRGDPNIQHKLQAQSIPGQHSFWPRPPSVFLDSVYWCTSRPWLSTSTQRTWQSLAEFDMPTAKIRQDYAHRTDHIPRQRKCFPHKNQAWSPKWKESRQ